MFQSTEETSSKACSNALAQRRIPTILNADLQLSTRFSDSETSATYCALHGEPYGSRIPTKHYCYPCPTRVGPPAFCEAISVHTSLVTLSAKNNGSHTHAVTQDRSLACLGYIGTQPRSHKRPSAKKAYAQTLHPFTKPLQRTYPAPLPQVAGSPPCTTRCESGRCCSLPRAISWYQQSRPSAGM